MKKVLLTFIFSFLIINAPNSFAKIVGDSVLSIETGHDLIKSCQAVLKIAEGTATSRDVDNATVCGSYLSGVKDMNYFVQAIDPNSINFCLPEKASLNQLSAIVVKHLRENPNSWGEAAVLTVVKSFKEAFICVFKEEENGNYSRKNYGEPRPKET